MTSVEEQLTGPAGTVTAAGIAAAAERIAPYLRRTPVITVDRADFGLPPGELVLKLELLQHSGSFKARGAFNNLLSREIPAAGVVAASGGNHGAAVAYAAGVLGIPARIFVPEVSSEAKISRIRSYGADLVVSGAAYSEAMALSEEWMAESGALQVHAYDSVQTMLGAGTCAAELLQQDGHINTVLAGVGGGGLLAGTAAACAGRVRVVGSEPDGAPTLTYAMKAGQPVDAPVGSVAVDSLAPRQVGVLSLAVISRYADGVVLVTDDAIRSAQQLLWDKLRIVGEPGGCAALAALLSGQYVPEPGERVAVIVSGANTKAVDFSR